MKTKKTILIAHEDRCFLEMLRSILSKRGYPVANTTMVQDHFQLLKKCKEQEYDIVIISHLINVNLRASVTEERSMDFKGAKKILLVNMARINKFINLNWENGSVVNSQEDGISKLIAVMHLPKKQIYISPSLAKKMFSVRSNLQRKYLFTKTELVVLRLVCSDLTSEQIAIRLGKSKRTIETHRSNMMQAAEIKTSAGLAAFAIENGLLNSDIFLD